MSETASISSSSSEKSNSVEGKTDASSERDGSSSGRSLAGIPPKISRWTENHLKSLGVEVVSSSVTSPINIVESVFVGAVHLLKFHKIEAKQFKQEILTNPPKGWENLKNYKSIFDILETELVKLESDVTDLNQMEQGTTWLPHQMTVLPAKWFTTYRLLFCRFYIMGEHFGRYLLYMAETKQGGGMITEKMYQKLFNLFLGMFGLLGNPAPPGRQTQIRSENVVSVPDIIMSQSGKILAVIEIKKHFKKQCVEEIEPPKKTRKMNAENNGRQEVNHLDEYIVGQTIGGELLVHLSTTASGENKILGIMVQETFVTFTYLEKKDKDGDYIMKFSKPYNYLDPEEREDLMEPLILLSLLQNNPKFLN